MAKQFNFIGNKKLIDYIIAKRHKKAPAKIMKCFKQNKKGEFIMTKYFGIEDVVYYYYAEQEGKELLQFDCITEGQLIAAERDIQINDVLDIVDIEKVKQCTDEQYDIARSINAGDIIRYRGGYSKIEKKTAKRLKIQTPQKGYKNIYITENEYKHIELLSKEEQELANIAPAKQWAYYAKV